MIFRTKLIDRKDENWTSFEGMLFNLITKHRDRNTGPHELMFSYRMKVCQAMLDAYDNTIDEINYERSKEKSV